MESQRDHLSQKSSANDGRFRTVAVCAMLGLSSNLGARVMITDDEQRLSYDGSNWSARTKCTDDDEKLLSSYS
jgi:hypothetical protein